MHDLPQGHKVLSKDTRNITAIEWPLENGACFRVGHNGVTLIEPYDESGHMANIPWLAVFAGEVIIARVPADHVSVYYN